MDIFTGLVDEKTLSVLRVFINNPDDLFHITKVSKKAKVSLATTFRIMNNLLEIKILKVQKISKFKIYQLAKNKKTKKLRKVI